MADETSDKESSGMDIPDVLQGFVLGNRSEALMVVSGTKILLANDAAARVFGYESGEQLACLSAADLLHPRSASVAEERGERRRIGDYPLEPVIYDCITRDGRPRLIESFAVPCFLDPRMAIVLIRDVTEQIAQLAAKDHALEHSTAERERALKALAEVENRYRLLADNASDVLWQTDMEGRLTYVSPAIRRLGYEPEEWIGHRIIEFLPPEEHESFKSSFAQIIREGRPQRIELRVRRKDGSHVWMEISIDLGLEDGTPVRVQGIARDITQRKEAEDALRLMSCSVDLAADLIFWVDREARIIYVNQAACRRLRYTREELLSMTVFDIDPNYVPSRWNEAWERLRSGRSYTVESRLRAKDGTEFPVELSVNYLEHGGIEYNFAFVRDISERKAAEAALRENEERFRTLFERMNEGFALCEMIWDEKGNPHDFRYLEVNPAIEKHTGMRREEFIGRTVREVFPGIESMWIEKYAEVVRTGEPVRIEAFGRQLGRWIEVNAFRLSGNRFGAIFSDVTSRKNAEQELRKTHRDLQKAYDLQRAFLNNVTHEVRTPLTSIQGYAKMLLERVLGPINPEQESILRKMVSCSERLLDMISNLLDAAQLGSGMLALRPSICDPAEIVSRAVCAIRPEAEEKGIAVLVELPKTPCTGVYDISKLSAVLSSLLSNAVKFTRQGEIRVILAAQASGVEIIVADTGIGIGGRNLPLIFDEFQQFEYSGKAKPAGFGIGLFIAAALVDVMGATLVVSSRRGIGSAFTLFVPSLANGNMDRKQAARAC